MESITNSAEKSINKQKEWDLLTEEVEAATDKLGLPIDPGIKETVIAMNAMGFQTSQSCEGHVDRENISPWVEIELFDRNDEATRDLMMHLFRLDDQMRSQLSDLAAMEAIADQRIPLVAELNRTMASRAQRVFALVNEYSKSSTAEFDSRLVITRLPYAMRIVAQGDVISDFYDPDQKRRKLREFQGEMRRFTDFVKDKFFND